MAAPRSPTAHIHTMTGIAARAGTARTVSAPASPRAASREAIAGARAVPTIPALAVTTPEAEVDWARVIRCETTPMMTPKARTPVPAGRSTPMIAMTASRLET